MSLDKFHNSVLQILQFAIKSMIYTPEAKWRHSWDFWLISMELCFSTIQFSNVYISF